MASPPPLKLSEQSGVTIIQFADKRLLEEMKIEAIRQAIGALVDSTARPLLLIDFHNVDYFSSAALGMLVAVNDRVKEKKGQLRLANIAPQIMQVFTLTKLDRLLRISSTRTGAINILTRISEENAMESP